MDQFEKIATSICYIIIGFITGFIIMLIIFIPRISDQDRQHFNEILKMQSKKSDIRINKNYYKTKSQILEIMLTNYRISNQWDVEVSAYTARREETNIDPENTAIMQKPIPGWTIAVSQDLWFLLGKRVYIEGFGVRYVNDLMNIRYTKTIDILVPTVAEARRIGRIESRDMTLIEPYKTIKDLIGEINEYDQVIN